MKDCFSPKEDRLETTTVWSFPNRGTWATHNGAYRGNWSPYIPRNIIKRYSVQGDVVLDAFVGGGTTLIEAKLLGRYGLGVDINPKAIELARNNLRFQYKDGGKAYTACANAADLSFMKDCSVDLICTHPPYANIIKYSNRIEGDISLCNVHEFICKLKVISEELYRVLKPGKICAFLIGDIRLKGNVVPLGFMTMQVFEESRFTLKEIIIKEQHNCKSTARWREKSLQYNFLLLAHEYLFVMQK